jgi:RNase P subunit RPR2
VTGPSRLLPFKHRHHAVSVRVVAQREGIPYELERTVCRECSRVLSERPLRRAAA